jgi:hypothetical protein
MMKNIFQDILPDQFFTQSSIFCISKLIISMKIVITNENQIKKSFSLELKRLKFNFL